MNDFLIKAQRLSTFGAIFCLGISLGVIIVSQAHFSDTYGLFGLAVTFFLAGAAQAYYAVRQKLSKEPV